MINKTKSGDPFDKIYTAVSSIPRGKVATYKQIAQMAKIANPRYVGFVLNKNKDQKNIPCHRVVKSDGKIANGYAFGGAKKQEEKLKNEGVPFLPNGRIDLKSCLYTAS